MRLPLRTLLCLGVVRLDHVQVLLERLDVLRHLYHMPLRLLQFGGQRVMLRLAQPLHRRARVLRICRRLAQLVVLLLQLVAAPLRANLSRTRAAGQRGVKEWSAPRCQKERSTDVNRREFSCGVDGVGQGAEEVA